MWIYRVQDSALNDKYTEVKARRKKKKNQIYLIICELILWISLILTVVFYAVTSGVFWIFEFRDHIWKFSPT